MRIALSSPLLIGCAGVVAILAGCSSTDSDSTPAGKPPAQSAVTSAAVDTFTASGNEPFWSVTAEGTTLVYSTPEIQPGNRFTATRSTVGDRVTFTGTDGSTPATLNITRKPCDDSMSGRAFDYSAEFVHGDQTLTGCAREGKPSN